jgi:hypothetical protein
MAAGPAGAHAARGASMSLVPPKYSIDTSALIRAHNEDYLPDVFPGVWAFLEALAGRCVLAASEEVLHELEAKDDELHTWARQNRGMFLPTSQQIQREVRSLLAQFPKLAEPEGDKASADPFVIALAHLNRCSVVSAERSRSGSTVPRKIPEVCRELAIEHLSVARMLRAEGAQFR